MPNQTFHNRFLFALLIIMCQFISSMSFAQNKLRGVEQAHQENEYIVVFKEVTATDLASRGINFAEQFNGQYLNQFPDINAVHLYLSENDAKKLSEHVEVNFVEANLIAKPNSYDWGADRLNQVSPLLDNHTTHSMGGLGQTVYMVDSGINDAHFDLQDRVSYFWDYSAANQGKDCFGHGTHTAGIVARTVPYAQIKSLRVIDCSGNTSLSVLLNALNYIKYNGTPNSVVYIGVTTPASTVLDNSVQGLINSGFFPVVPAGNDNMDVNGVSPARVSGAITVAALSDTDNIASFSNYGYGIDVYAPGVDIDSAYYPFNDSRTTLSGTSQAAAYTAGVLSGYLSKGYHPSVLLQSATNVNGKLVPFLEPIPIPVQPPAKPVVSIDFTPGKSKYQVIWSSSVLHAGISNNTVTEYVVRKYTDDPQDSFEYSVGLDLHRTFESDVADTYFYQVKACNQSCSGWSSPASISIAQANPIAHIGDLNGDNYDDIYVGEGSNVTQAVTKSADPFVITQTPDKTFNGNISIEGVNFSNWQATTMAIEFGDFNLDGATDALIKGVSEFLPGVDDQMVFDSTVNREPPFHVTKVDEAFEQFFANLRNWTIDQDYFNENAPLATDEEEVKVALYLPNRCVNPNTGVFEGDFNLSSQGKDLDKIIDERKQYEDECLGRGCVSVLEFVDITYKIRIGEKDYSVFNQNAYIISETNNKMTDESEKLNQVDNEFTKVLGVEKGDVVIEASDEELKTDEAKEWFQFHVIMADIWSAIFKGRIAEATHQQNVIYITGHRVGFFGPFHLAIEFKNSVAKKIVSAGPDWNWDFLKHVLESKPNNRDEDLKNIILGTVTPTISGQSNIELFDDMAESANDDNYKDCLDYDLFPEIQDSYNSNSFVHGIIIENTGLSSIDLNDFIGGGKPVPSKYYNGDNCL